MKKFTFHYKDHLGRSNKTDSYGNDSLEATKKFNTLYPTCTIVKIETSFEELVKN